MIHVGVAEWHTARSPDALRTTLGSCVGIVLYDINAKIGGVAHVLLSEPPTGKIVNKGKYAKTAIEALIKDLQKQGTDNSYKARIFGGASMFDSFHSSFLNDIGEKNVTAVKKVLNEQNIPLIVEEVGGNAGRSITVYMDDGRILLRENGKEKYIYKV